jgi:hypothetical protein
MFVKLYSNRIALDTTNKVASYEQKPSAIVEVTTVEQLKSHLELAQPHCECSWRGKKNYTVSDALNQIGFIATFFNFN